MFQFTQNHYLQIHHLKHRLMKLRTFHNDIIKIARVVITKFTDNPLPLSFWFEVAKEPSKILNYLRNNHNGLQIEVEHKEVL